MMDFEWEAHNIHVRNLPGPPGITYMSKKSSFENSHELILPLIKHNLINTVTIKSLRDWRMAKHTELTVK